MKLNLTKFILIALVLVINFILYRSSLIAAYTSFKGKNLVGEVKMGKLWTNFEKLRTDAIEYSGWSERDKIDLSLDPRTKGLAIYKFEKPETANITVLQLAFVYPNEGSNKVSISTNKINWETISENKRYHLIPLEITKYLKEGKDFWIKLEAANNNPLTTTGPPAVVLYDFYLMFYRHEFKFPPLILILASIFFPILIIIRPDNKKIIKLSLLFLVFSLGFHLALKNLDANRYHSFDSDVICLIQEVPRFLSLDFKSAVVGNYCGNKESLNPLIIIAFWKLFGYGSEVGIRFSSLFFHLMTIVSVFWYGKKIKSFTTGLVAALFIGTHPYLIELSARGLRDSAFTFIITLFVFLLFETSLRKLRNIIMIFLTSIASIYLRLHSLIQLIGLTLVFVIAKRKLKQGLIVTILLILTALPLIQNNLKTYQTWNYSEAIHFKWNANVEFAGQPGFPSKESVTLNPFQGLKISPYTYFFKLHTIPDLIISSFKGIITTFNNLYFKNNSFGLILFILGGWLMIKNKHFWYIPFLVFFLEIPHFFLVEKNLLEFRSMTHSLPLIGLTIGYIIDRVWIKLKRC